MLKANLNIDKFHNSRKYPDYLILESYINLFNDKKQPNNTKQLINIISKYKNKLNKHNTIMLFNQLVTKCK